ncbi:ferrous iron transport protein B [Velocimicrobium porci]|uniref:Ferrous iron transport protein B n=1 Tax=Velocimicrobium porci TaxID=2606634 RepID=A0A6L5XUF0_9FIRM|nr:ferrous iron transport protein B [Velocimicrobium porci]MSS62440.1 ferrous iron transport protein B [Velocimicrobium porci]
MTTIHTLSALNVGEQAIVTTLLTSGTMRRRLQDIGLIEGTCIECLLKSPCGNPSAYLIRGAVIALRSEDSSSILIKKTVSSDKVIALVGNPNVGKSTVFNYLTGLKQHTGNWPGKTVAIAQGYCNYKDSHFTLVDLPGCYSFLSQSAEEEVTRDFIGSNQKDAVLIVCDASCIERNLNLVLQTLEITNQVIVCVNLIDEAERNHIHIDLKQLSNLLHVPVVATSALTGDGMDELLETIYNTLFSNQIDTTASYFVPYPKPIEEALSVLSPHVERYKYPFISTRFASLKLLMGKSEEYHTYIESSIEEKEQRQPLCEQVSKLLKSYNLSKENLQDLIATSLVTEAEQISHQVVNTSQSLYKQKDQKIDKILTNKKTGLPIMLLLLFCIFWITITGANYPSELLSHAFLLLENKLVLLLHWIHAPNIFIEIFIDGIYRVLAWVISVMLPPMAIFFPLFTLLEDLGYLPRIAFNLDHCFKRCCACGKQALTMCMGFGCNAAGVVGCRIINSDRERLIALLTNSFVPCNGRFPTLIAIINMFFITVSIPFCSFYAACLLTLFILLGIGMTFLASTILSKTILKGVPSAFTLELPPYRKPQFGKILIHSILDRTIFVLLRAIAVAAPAGLIIWILANITVHDTTLLTILSNFLDPLGKCLGMDGVILLSFLLGWPANEIVIPIMIMAYLSTGSIQEFNNLFELKQLLVENGWTLTTAISTLLFMMFHWPCSTTCLTIKKETGSLKWTLIAFLLPTITGILICFLVHISSSLFLSI